MREECRHCRTINVPRAPYCEACGADFPKQFLTPVELLVKAVGVTFLAVAFYCIVVISWRTV